MASPPLDKKKDAQYHIILATEQWAGFVNTMLDEAASTIATRARMQARTAQANSYSQDLSGVDLT
jgi:hypothetical protein